MWFSLIFFVFVNKIISVVPTSEAIIRSILVQTIGENVHDHGLLPTSAFNPSAIDICTVVKHRLSKHGIIMSSVFDCVSTKIDSIYGESIYELYQTFHRLEPRFLKRRMDDEYVARLKVKHACVFSFMFQSGILQWSIDNAPDVKLDRCLSEPMLSGSTPEDCFPVRNDTVLYHDFALLPFQNCTTAIDNLNTKRLKVRDERELQRELPVLLDMDIAKVWRYQMPNKIEEISHVIGLKHP